MLENFTTTVNPDNRHTYLNTESEDDIIIGGSCKHVFNLPFVYSKFAKDLEINYKQGLYIILSKYAADVTISEGKTETIVECNLTPEDTEKFEKNVLDTFVQIKITNNLDQVIYNEPSRLKVVKPLDY